MALLPSSGLAPGYVRPNGSFDGRRSLGGLVTAVTALLAITTVTGLVHGYAAWRGAGLMDDALTGRRVTQRELDSADVLSLITLSINVLVMIATGVVFMIWFWKLAKNAQLLDPVKAPGAGWAIGSWFVPIFNFWLPGLNLARANRASDDGRPPGRLLIVGWTLAFDAAWVADRAVAQAVPREYVTRDDWAAAVAADRAVIYVELVWMVAAVLAVIMVRRLTKRQDDTFLRLEEVMRTAAEASAARQATLTSIPGYSAPIAPPWGTPSIPGSSAPIPHGRPGTQQDE